MISESQQQDATDRQIDRTLQALAAAHPSPDFNVRLLARLESRQSDAASRPRFALLAIPKWWGVAATSLLLCVVGLFLARSRDPRSPGQLLPAEHHAAELRLEPQAGAPVEAALPAATAGPSPRTRQAPVFALAIANAAASESAAASLTSLPSAQSLDEQALADLHAPSQPAPPIPTTDQERLVALMLRRGEKQDLAQLDPARLSRDAVRDQAAFSNFFDPPAPPESIVWELHRPAGASVASPPAAQPDSSGAETKISLPPIQPLGDPK